MPVSTEPTNVIIDWSSVKQQVLKCLDKGERWDKQPMGEKLQMMHRNPYEKDTWQGGGGADTLKVLREGFSAPEFAHSAEYVPTAIKRRNYWNDQEGDVDAGRLLAGNDDFFLGSQKRLSKPGLRVQIEFAFAWTVSSKTLQEYGAWVAGFLGSLESSGFDLVVDMWIPMNDIFQGIHGRSNILIRVKQPNEISDFTEWSALFGPTGFRVLGFSAMCVAGDKIGKRVHSYFGMTLGDKTWNCEYLPDEALVSINVNQRAGPSEAFPREKLTEQAIAAKLIPAQDLTFSK
jgi:hypothetical protein